MIRTTVMVSTEALLGLVDGPAMLSKYVRIGDYITDAVVLDVHPEVARWYGYNDPEQMRGRYVSQLHDRECLQQVRRIIVARHLGLPVPEIYDIRICLPNGQYRWLRKQEVRQINDGSEIYWVTQSTPVSASEAVPPPEVELPLSPAELEQIIGWGGVADIERLVVDVKASGATGDASLLFPSPGADPESYIPSTQAVINAVLAHPENYESFEIPTGDPDSERWSHRCQRCSKRWVGSAEHPKKCTYCKSPYWAVRRQRLIKKPS